MIAQKLNEATIGALAVPANGNKLHFFSGALVQGSSVPRGFAVRVTAGGAKSFVMDYRVGARQRRYTIGAWPDWTALAAVKEARDLRKRIDRGEDPLADREAAKAKGQPQPESEPVKDVSAVIDEFMVAHVEKRLRRPDNYRWALERLVKPAIGALPIHGLRRSQIAVMLDGIEEQSGPVMADRTLSYLSSALNWYAARDDDFIPPRLKGMKRATGRGRDRVLSDDDIRVIWRVAENGGTFGAVVRLLLLTGQRRGDVLGMEWGELDGGTWTIPGKRYKTGRPHTVLLSSAALEIVEARPRDRRLVFPGRDGGPLGIGGSRKLSLNAAITKANGRTPLTPWTVHDLRRTARTLMARAGVRPDVAERVVGHVIRGVEGIYDRYTYEADKRDALERLAGLFTKILEPRA